MDEGIENERVDEFLDCQGKVRRFKVVEYGNGHFLSAQEMTKANRPGLRFLLVTGPDGVPPYFDLNKRIRERLAQRSVVMGPKGLDLLTDTVRGQFTDALEGDDEGEVGVVIDDLVISWSELGRLLKSHIGFGFRLELHTAGEE